MIVLCLQFSTKNQNVLGSWTMHHVPKFVTNLTLIVNYNKIKLVDWLCVRLLLNIGHEI